jgi:hypothetical protein
MSPVLMNGELPVNYQLESQYGQYHNSALIDLDDEYPEYGRGFPYPPFHGNPGRAPESGYELVIYVSPFLPPKGPGALTQYGQQQSPYQQFGGDQGKPFSPQPYHRPASKAGYFTPPPASHHPLSCHNTPGTGMATI